MVSATTRQVTGQGSAEQKVCGSIRWRRVRHVAYPLELLLREHAVAVLVHQCEELRRFGRGMGRRCIEHQFKPARGEQRAAHQSLDNRVHAPLARVLQTRPFLARRREWDACALCLIDHPIAVGVCCPIVVRQGHLVGRIAQPRAGSLRGRVGRTFPLEEARPRPRHCCLVRSADCLPHTRRAARSYDGPVTTTQRETCELS